VLASASADAAGLSPNLNMRSSSTNNTTTFAGRPAGHYGPTTPPPIPRSTSNDQFDTNGNINPGGGGGSFKPGKSPNKK
jgi:hypothetical protein